MATCKVIATAFSQKRAVKPATNWPYHSQILSTEALYSEMVRKLAKLEMTEDPGEPMDTFIMVYKDEWGAYKEWLQYDQKPTVRGTMNIVVVEEDGGCYLLYDRGFQINREKYEWFLITCDDVCLLGENYLTKIKEKWTPYAGYIAMQGLNDSPHVHGSIGLTHRNILDQVCEINNGELPHPKGVFVQEANILYGERPFTNLIHQLGYELVKFNDSEEWKRDNLCMPYHNIRTSIQ